MLHSAVSDLGLHCLHAQVCLFVCVRFYGTVNPIGSCRTRSVYLIQFYWAGLVH